MVTLILFFVFGTQVQLSTIPNFATLSDCMQAGAASQQGLPTDTKDSTVPKAAAFRCVTVRVNPPSPE